MKTTIFFRNILGIGLGLFLIGGNTVAQERHEEEGRVYVMTNKAAGNTIMVLRRDEDGTLTFLQEAPTGGLGSGPAALPPPFPPGPGPNPLKTQDSLISVEDGRFLLASNSGSNEVSVLAVTEDGLQLVDKVSSQGIFPDSITFHDGLVYVLNAGENPDLQAQGLPPTGSPSIAGFRLDFEGRLHFIPNSAQVAGGFGADPADIVFSPDGDLLVITEKISNQITVFRVEKNGRVGEKISFPSNTPTPASIAFGRHGILTITESNVIVVNGQRQLVRGGAALSSYRVTDEDQLEPISKSVPNNQSFTGWHRFTPDGRFIFTANTGSGNISTYSVAKTGELTLLTGAAADTGGRVSSPMDLEMTRDGKFLYVVSGFIGTVEGYLVGEDGTLTQITSFPGFPVSVAGLVVR